MSDVGLMRFLFRCAQSYIKQYEIIHIKKKVSSLPLDKSSYSKKGILNLIESKMHHQNQAIKYHVTSAPFQKLPNELLHYIFVLLPIVQKQVCILVCKKWAGIIRSHSLLHTIRLPYDEVIYKKALRRMECQPNLCKQVEHLTLPGFTGADCNRESVLHLFPNLKTIKTVRRGTSIYITNKTSKHSRSFQSQLKHIEDIHPFNITRSVLASGTSSGLTTLILHDRIDDSAYKEILPLLNSVPLLNHLSLSNSNISIEKCETIHNSLPLLQHFHLLECRLVESFLPVHLLSATTVVTLVIETIGSTQHFYSQWLQYISMKYPNLEHLKFNSGCHNTNVAYTDMLNEFDYPVLLKHIGSRLKSLELACVQHSSTIFKMLDHYDCRINSLSLYNVGKIDLHEFSRLKLSNSIEDFSLCGVDSLSNMPFKMMESLKSLKIQFEASDDYYAQMPIISLNKIFNSLSKTIETLTITATNAYIYTDESNQQFSIKKLTLDGIRLSLNEVHFIANSFPDLHILKVNLIYYGCLGLPLLFPNNQFTLLDLDFYCSEFRVALITMNDTQTRYFYLKGTESCKDYSLLGDGILPVPKEDFGDAPSVTLSCGSLKTLCLNGIRAYF